SRSAFKAAPDLSQGFRGTRFAHGSMGERHANGGALALLRLKPHIAVMERRQCLHQSKAKPGPFVHANLLSTRLLERLAEPFQIAFRNSHSCVGDGDLD